MTEADFFDSVRQMPFVEAEQILRDRKNELLRRHPPGTSEYASAGLAVAAINDEIHMLTKAQDRVKIMKAVRACFGDEGAEQVLVWMAMQDQRA